MMKTKIFVYTMALSVLVLMQNCNPEEAKKEVTIEKDTLVKVVENDIKKGKDTLIINRQEMTFQDTENPTDFELKHTPEFVVGETDENGFTMIEIKIGSKGIVHPTEENHWIDYLDLYQNDKLVGHIEYGNGIARGYTVFMVKAESGSLLRAEAGCNIHGIWQNTMTMK